MGWGVRGCGGSGAGGRGGRPGPFLPTMHHLRETNSGLCAGERDKRPMWVTETTFICLGQAGHRLATELRITLSQSNESPCLRGPRPDLSLWRGAWRKGWGDSGGGGGGPGVLQGESTRMQDRMGR